ncbi:MAG: T9SS type A sorting domain-containing protein [Saprospiraceae bacterium]|nr:T9SS type A sorting domain-containing protein [Saprospiraceae bacterium]
MTSDIKYCLFSIFIFLGTAINSFSQNPFDCIDAMPVCDNSDLTIDYDTVQGQFFEDISNFCSDDDPFLQLIDDNTVWLKYKFVSSGDFYFTITSTLQVSDIDFFVFTSESNSCDDLESIRCMLTGPNFMSATDPICTGPTGLSPSSTDTEEGPGCFDDNDNFLAPINVEQGDLLILAVSAFDSNNRYTIEHGGSAEISCSSNTLDESNGQKVRIYPNPVEDILHLIHLDVKQKNMTLEIVNQIGQKVATSKQSEWSSIDVSHLSKGIYYLRFISENTLLYSDRIVKIK